MCVCVCVRACANSSSCGLVLVPLSEEGPYPLATVHHSDSREAECCHGRQSVQQKKKNKMAVHNTDFLPLHLMEQIISSISSAPTKRQKHLHPLNDNSCVFCSLVWTGSLVLLKMEMKLNFAIFQYLVSPTQAHLDRHYQSTPTRKPDRKNMSAQRAQQKLTQ